MQQRRAVLDGDELDVGRRRCRRRRRRRSRRRRARSAGSGSRLRALRARLRRARRPRRRSRSVVGDRAQLLAELGDDGADAQVEVLDPPRDAHHPARGRGSAGAARRRPSGSRTRRTACPWSGSKRSTAFSTPSIATCSRSSSGSLRFAKRRGERARQAQVLLDERLRRVRSCVRRYSRNRSSVSDWSSDPVGFAVVCVAHIRLRLISRNRRVTPSSTISCSSTTAPMIDLLTWSTSTGSPVAGQLPSISTRPGDAVYRKVSVLVGRLVAHQGVRELVDRDPQVLDVLDRQVGPRAGVGGGQPNQAEVLGTGRDRQRHRPLVHLPRAAHRHIRSSAAPPPLVLGTAEDRCLAPSRDRGISKGAPALR